MNEVYVVTVSATGQEIGEFHKEEAYYSMSVALQVAYECMEERGGRDRHVEQPVRADQSHVVHCWVGPRFTVWLERLELVR